MARKATDQVAKRGVKIGKSSFHLIGLDGRLGSKTDLQRHAHLRPLTGVKQTSNVRFLSPKRSCRADVCFLG